MAHKGRMIMAISCKTSPCPKPGAFKVPKQTLLKNDEIKQTMKEVRFYKS
jgi:hypothetical protein